jgi:hypothetical protein
MQCQVFASAVHNTVEEQFENGEAIELSVSEFIICTAGNHLCRHGGYTPHGMPLWMHEKRPPLGVFNGRPC